MNKTATFLLVGAALVGGYLLLKKRNKPTPQGPTTNGPQIGDGDLATPAEPIPPVEDDFGCGGNFQDVCGTINFVNPASNVGCCGKQVYNFQHRLNQYGAFGLVEDGKYGNTTKQAHDTVRSGQAIPPDFPGVNFSF